MIKVQKKIKGIAEINAATKNRTVPGLQMSPKDVRVKELETKRAEYQTHYMHWLRRKNKFYEKLAVANRSTSTSNKYQELDTEVKKYFALIRAITLELREIHGMWQMPPQ